MGSYFRGDIDEADRWFATAYSVGLATEQVLVAASALAYRSLVAGEHGRVEDQRLLAEQASTSAETWGVADIAGEVHVALGVSLAARGHVRTALPLLDRGVLVMRAWGQPIDLAKSLLRLVSALRSVGELDRAAATMKEARTIIDGCPDPGTLRDRLAMLEHPHRLHSPRGGEQLTERELGVLRLLAGPGSEREIADALCVSFNTVHSQVRAVYLKLGVSTRADAVARARSVGLR
jgi:LuxR family maltose regulon positive regulatory protein